MSKLRAVCVSITHSFFNFGCALFREEIDFALTFNCVNSLLAYFAKIVDNVTGGAFSVRSKLTPKLLREDGTPFCRCRFKDPLEDLFFDPFFSFLKAGVF